MSKRKLSDQQKTRIQQSQTRRLRRAAADLDNLGEEQQGLLLAFFGVYADVEDSQKIIQRCRLRQNLGAVVAGDRVLWRVDVQSGVGVVVAVLPRRNLLSRPVAPGKSKAMAANVDTMFLVIAVQPRPVISMIDSYLVAAESNRLNAVLVCNKSDLLTPTDRAALLEMLAIYRKLNYPVIFASAQSRSGLNDLEQHMQGHTGIFVGQSGVGKSSLVAELLPAAEVRVDALSPEGDHGMHTTTAARLYHLPSGGDLIDSPGVRDFRLWNMPPKEIAAGFIEFRDYLGRCQFRDCTHLDEQRCALQQGLAEGAIDVARLQSFRRIIAGQTGG